jgi:predicted N-acetyltransferase YhbS
MVVFALAVLPEFQKQGIARRLMSTFAEEARQQGKENVLLLCKRHRMAYYEKMGFIHMGLSRSTHGGTEWHEMGLRL